MGLVKSDSIKTDVLTGKFLATGELPVNVSGGLIAKGHPLGATGIGMVVELSKQLRGESLAHQVNPNPKVALFKMRVA